MTLINGVKIESNNASSQNSQRQPTMNEVLNRMQNNYDNINSRNISTENTNDSSTNNNEVTNILGTAGGGKDSLIKSLLPMLMSANKTNESPAIDSNKLIDMIVKNTNNPNISKLLELMPLISKNKTKTQSKEDSTTEKPKINSFVKTDDYKD